MTAPHTVRPVILLYVQNLLGIGHLRRAAAVARALSAAGMDVAFVSGGMPVPHLPLGAARMVQLPPIRAADGDFKKLLDDTDTPAATGPDRAADGDAGPSDSVSPSR